MPEWVSIFGASLVALGLMIDFLVFLHNSFGVDHRDDGRPASDLDWSLCLGQTSDVCRRRTACARLLLGLAVVLVYVPLHALRIRDGKAMLLRKLDGYAENTRSVRHRLVPGVG